ncbi:aminotransferase class V-fold PLP-dependent enzyme [Enterovirga rhinocerotis]|uniref:Selenocysteine lyase/cysteine desulfurase n=1 Tax=Enterovirga rhinocerotis TaxID=1339210 RepID=A0A4R7CB97_9HYPH|nr:aminotransferase class V-fold PLP-dependent enzyme [Enterovirga rhinocerotis]TDR94346.1 selenocysteine lyase/cysteine desulfurase [Enterovirga rhinocerotis]
MTQSLPPLFDPGDFAISPGIVHVCAGGESAPLRSHGPAVEAYLRDKAEGMVGRDAQEDVIGRVRARAGAVWSVPDGDIGFVANVAEGMSMLVESIDWRDGDTVCVEGSEYPSVVAPFLAAARRAPQVRFARGTGPDRIVAAIDSTTRLVAVSYVSYLNGERFDLARLRARADEVGALLVVDYTQAAGYLPIDASVADFAFSACYKWLLGVTGCALAFWNRARQPHWRPRTAGWYSLATGARPDYREGLALRPDALRFTRGNPSHVSLYVLDGALAYLERFRPEKIQAHVQALTTTLHERLRAAGLDPSTPADPARHGASICIDGDYGPHIPAELQRRGILLWGNRGRLRISFHGYNGETDIDRIMTELPAVLRG